jgi:hypothetical protein
MSVRLGLVKYRGGKLAPFEVEKEGKRWLWSADRTPTEHVKSARWLPEPEAKAYDMLPDFAVTRWGEDTKQQLPPQPGQKRKSRRPRPRRTDVPEPAAIPLRVLLEAQEATKRAEEKRNKAMAESQELDEQLAMDVEEPEEPEARFILSTSGILHRRDCSSCPKKPIGEFLTLDDGALASRFKKFHRCIQ